VPVFRAVGGEKGRGRDRLADPAAVDQVAAGLQAPAQEGIRGASDQDAFLPGGARVRLGLRVRFFS
jgi:hypothetical protein